MEEKNKKGLGVPRSKAAGRSTAPNLLPKKAKGFPPTPSRKETKHEKMASMILEIAAAMAFKRSSVSARQKPIYLMAFVDGARFVQATNRAARERQQQITTLEAIGIATKNPQRVSARIRKKKNDGSK